MTNLKTFIEILEQEPCGILNSLFLTLKIVISMEYTHLLMSAMVNDVQIFKRISEPSVDHNKVKHPVQKLEG